VKVFCQRGENVWVWENGDLKKVAKCKIQLFKNNFGMVPEALENEEEKNEGAMTISQSKEARNGQE
jgi:hypothetical protein